MRMHVRRALPLFIFAAVALGMISVPASAQDTLEALDFGSGTAVVEIGGERYEFDMSTRQIGDDTFVGVCQSIFGLIQANGRASDDRAITIEMELPPADWETKPEFGFAPPNIKFTDEDNDVELVAGKSLAELLGVETESQATVTESDGYDAVGTATFVDSRAMQMGEPTEVLEGTFEVHCDRDE